MYSEHIVYDFEFIGKDGVEYYKNVKLNCNMTIDNASFAHEFGVEKGDDFPLAEGIKVSEPELFTQEEITQITDWIGSKKADSEIEQWENDWYKSILEDV